MQRLPLPVEPEPRTLGLRYNDSTMRILIVHHGRLPSATGPTTGGALRAWHHLRALQAAGHEVHTLSRAQDAPGGFASLAELALRARALEPDRIVCVQPEDAVALGGLGVPLAVDLYAPRLLEAPFEGALQQAAVHTLRALSAGDVFVVSNPRQRLVWLGVLALAGVDTRSEPTLHVPLVAPEPEVAAPPETPVIVAGGAAWPWQDPAPGVHAALAALDALGTGEIRWYGARPAGLPDHPRLSFPGWLPYPALLEAYAGATLALDWMSANPERSTALSFRQLDYLGCGLPIVSHPDSALADVLGRAGWLSVHTTLQQTLTKALQDPAGLLKRRRAARTLAEKRFSLATAEAPLVAWVETASVGPRAQGPLVDAATLAASAGAAQARREAAEEARAAAEAEAVRKREETARLTVQLQELTGTVARQARALDEVAGFKREAIAILGGQAEAATLDARESGRLVAALQADVEKKSAEVVAAEEQRVQLLEEVQAHRRELASLKADVAKTSAELHAADEQRAQLLEETKAQRRELATLRADNGKKSAELQAMDDLATRLENDLTNVRRELAALRSRRWR